MKYRIFIIGLATLLFAACSVNEMNFATPLNDNTEEFFATIEDSSTKVFVDDKLRVLWNADDRVSIFNKYTYNQEYRFTGEDGDNSGAFKKVPNDDFVTGNTLDLVYSVYPYQESTKITNDGEITVVLPTEQTYREDSFGLGANTMISVTENNELLFKNLCGYISVKLYGDNVTVKSISLKGNNNEPLAGKAAVTASIGNAPSMAFDASATKEITLLFDTPVKIGTTADEATTFWLVVPPTTFSKGITLTVKDNKNGEFKKSTTASLQISRNTLKRMSALQTNPEPSNEPIVFADIIAKSACVEKFDTNGDGEVSYAEAAAATTLEGLFANWNTVTSFDEIQFFTGITSTNGVFSGLSELTHITIPDWILTLGDFKGCTSLESVILPANLSSLPAYCFADCSSLSDVTLPASITSIPSYCFANCKALTTLDLPDGIQTIALLAFTNCDALTTLDLPDGIKTIENYAFYNCPAITTIDFPDTLTYIGYCAFSNCSSLVSVTLPDNVYLDGYAFSYCSNLASVVLPTKLKVIPQSCFEYCSNLATITWPQALTTIKNNAFDYCRFKNHDYTLELPSSVTIIGEQAFGAIRHLIIPSTSTIHISADSFVSGYTYLYVPNNMVEMYKGSSDWSDYIDYIRPISDYPVELAALGGTIGEAVDLGLSVKWASWNVGSSAPEEYGGHFAWGETEVKWDYDWSTYKWCNGSDDFYFTEYSTLTKYNTRSDLGSIDNKTVLDPEDDAAHVHWGGTWRMPTNEEWTELKNNCSWEWMTMNGINGQKVTGPNGNSIFLPAAGMHQIQYIHIGTYGNYWSSTLDLSGPTRGRDAVPNSNGMYQSGIERCNGLSIRPVSD